MTLVLVTGMPLEPHACIACARGPRDNNGNIQENVFAEAIDVNWGDSVYLCPTCVRVMAELFGFTTPEDTEELHDRIKELEGIEEKYTTLSKRVKKMIDGGRARKEVIDGDASRV